MSKCQNAAERLIVLTSHPIQYQAPLWRAMAARRLDFEVWFLTDQGVRRTEDTDFGNAFAWDMDLLSGYSHRFLALRGPWNLRKFNGIPLAEPIGELLKEAGATALWTEGWRFKVQWDAVAAAKKMGINVILRGETSDKIRERRGLCGMVRRIALRRLFARVNHFLAIGQASRRFYLRYGVPARKLLDAPYCVDNEFFRDEAEKHRECGTATIRQAWNISEEAKVVLFCGKFIPKKRPMDLVEAARLHHAKLETGRKDQPWHLLFVGSGELGADLRSACDVRFDAESQNSKISKYKNASSPPASFAGFLNQSEIAKAYAVADLLALPSDAWETWGLVVNEATAAGVPAVVSSSCGCAEDFAAKNPFVRIFDTGDVAGLAFAISELLTLDGTAADVSSCAQAFAPSVTVRSVAGILAGEAGGHPCTTTEN